MNGQPKDPAEAIEAGRPRLVAVEFGNSTGLVVVGGEGPAVALCNGSAEAQKNTGWARAIANRWNLHHDLADGLRRLVGAAQCFATGRLYPTGDLEMALGTARDLLDRVDGRDRKATPLPPVKISGCPRDTDGDGNCYLHPKGCPRADGPASFELRITVEPGVDPDEVARAVQETLERRLEETAQQMAQPAGVEALYQFDQKQVRDLLWEVANLFRALPQRYQPGDDRAEWEREFSGEPFSVPDVTLLLRFAVERAKAEAGDESAAAALDKGVAELILDLPAHLKGDDAEQKVRSGKLPELVAALTVVRNRVQEEWGSTSSTVKAVPLWCTHCGAPHVDEGEWASRIHREHRCASCGGRWRIDPPAIGAQVPPGDTARRNLASADLMEATAGIRIRCDQGDKLVVDLRTFQVRELGLDVATDEEIAALGGKIPDTEQGRAALQALRARKEDDRKDELVKMGASLLRHAARDQAPPHPAMLRQVAEGLDSLASELPTLRQRLVAAEAASSKAEETMKGHEAAVERLQARAEAAEERAGKAEARAAKAETEGDGWKRSFEIYRKAWIRELGGPEKVPAKSHEVDELVSATEALRLRAQAGEAGVRAELSELRARSDEAAELRRRTLELEGKLEGSIIRASGAVKALADAGKLGPGAEEAVAAIRAGVTAELVPEHLGLLVRLQEQAVEAGAKLTSAQARLAELEGKLRGADAELRTKLTEAGANFGKWLVDEALRASDPTAQKALRDAAGKVSSIFGRPRS